MKKTKIPLEQPYRRELIDYLNVVLAMNEQSHRYWNEILIRKLERKFGVVALNAAERNRGGRGIASDLKWWLTHFEDYRTDGLLLLLQRVLDLTGVRLACMKVFESQPNAWLARGDE